jgi:hypothetical protein
LISDNIEYIQLEEMIYRGLDLKLSVGLVKGFVTLMRKKLGENTYIRRLVRFVNYTTNPEVDPSQLEDLISDDFSDNETLKKSITAFKVHSPSRSARTKPKTSSRGSTSTSPSSPPTRRPGSNWPRSTQRRDTT